MTLATLIPPIARAAETRTDDELNWPTVVIALGFGMGVLVLTTILIVVVVREIGRSKRARAEIAREAEYKLLAERYDTFTSSTAAAQERYATDVAEVRRRLTEVEALLRTVE